MKDWMRGSLAPIISEIFSKESVESRGLFQYSELKKYYQAFLDDKMPYEFIWKIVMLEVWLKKNQMSL